MILETSRTEASVEDHDFYTEYHYVRGDQVDVECSKVLGQHGKLTMSYSFEDILTLNDNDKFHAIAEQDNTVLWFTGNLTAEHNNCYMICKLINDHDFSIAKVKFVMKQNNDGFTIVIDNAVLRYQKQKGDTNIYINYVFKPEDKRIMYITISSTNIEKMYMPIYNDMKKIVKVLNKTQNGAVISVDPKYNVENIRPIVLTATIKYISRSDEKLNIMFREVKGITENWSFRMEGLSNNKLLELNKDRTMKYIYYNFHDGEKLKLRCKSDKPTVRGTLIWLDRSYAGPIDIELTSDYNGLKIICNFQEFVRNRQPVNVGQITVLLTQVTTQTTSTTELSVEPTTSGSKAFDVTKSTTYSGSTATETTRPTSTVTESMIIPYTPDSSESTKGTLESTTEPFVDSKEDNSDNMIWIFVALGIVTCLIIVCVITVMVRIKRRAKSQVQNEPNYMNFSNQNESPQLQSNYAVPIDRREEGVYIEPYKSESDLYSIPQKKKKEVTYAVLDIANLPKTSKCVKFDETNYAVVSYNKEESTYNNVPNAGVGYVNTSNGEYIEPTYCEANFNNK